jgi:small subunit ribosomal protein S20
MATHKSAEKRNRQNKKRNLRNNAATSAMKTAIKAVRDAAVSGSKEDLLKTLKNAQKIVAQTIRKGVLHKNTGARYISRLAKTTSKSAK